MKRIISILVLLALLPACGTTIKTVQLNPVTK